MYTIEDDHNNVYLYEAGVLVRRRSGEPAVFKTKREATEAIKDYKKHNPYAFRPVAVLV